MDQNLHHQPKLMHHRCCSHEEVNSMEWEFISMSKQEEDLIYRMHKLVGDRWGLIAGRIPGRTAEEIERFWIMKHSDGFANKRRQLRKV
ncbi:MYB-like transcription factor ETC3 [Nicotiana tabacum]|uniref:MYB-like transcription factor ETC3 n=2 Tax=Nicotiana TaxID=4085 RepID=A0A1S4CLV6_TOBAC|nr:MYB-like transcription factor ETC3 [Nicotiana tomentosiformis]XP_009761639.1 PREDICTED: MYB-like transcription factor ETC3 [Nicotiana sylvestris]XP_016464336.1 PREDICTED: MYB-like transcription factor ETC3 [Nicotiana tabacum]XP_016502110.1 PREDICTED: MYB-like transcription factor ETC3 [Nicotiana tabacum]XP_019252948.1 PREDICTED: MYB-like transcription factor ETC3 isoform X2 [Nicotiana attenuata]